MRSMTCRCDAVRRGGDNIQRGGERWWWWWWCNGGGVAKRKKLQRGIRLGTDRANTPLVFQGSIPLKLGGWALEDRAWPTKRGSLTESPTSVAAK